MEESSGLKRKLSQAQELLDQMTENEDPDTASAIERYGYADRSTPSLSTPPAEWALQDMPAVEHTRRQRRACPHCRHPHAHRSKSPPRSLFFLSPLFFLPPSPPSPPHAYTHFLHQRYVEEGGSWRSSLPKRLKAASGSIEQNSGTIAEVQAQLKHTKGQLARVLGERQKEQQKMSALTGSLTMIKDIVLAGMTKNTSPRRKAKLRRSMAVLDSMTMPQMAAGPVITAEQGDAPTRFGAPYVNCRSITRHLQRANHPAGRDLPHNTATRVTRREYSTFLAS